MDFTGAILMGIAGGLAAGLGVYIALMIFKHQQDEERKNHKD